MQTKKTNGWYQLLQYHVATLINNNHPVYLLHNKEDVP